MDRNDFQDHPEGSAPAKLPKRLHIPYLGDPDFSKPLFKIPSEARERMFARLTFLYGEAEAKQWMPELERIIKVHYAHKPQALIDAEKNYDPTERFTEQDMVLITYGDAVKGERGSTLSALHRFIQTYNRGAINTIHILPFFPYSSDRGFAIIDFKMVDPQMGTWESVKNIGADYDLMFDGVLNHCSSRSEMFREFLRGNPMYKDFFIVYDSPDDLTPDQRSKIFRPRTSDILTRFDTINGPKYVWTTFSEDQIDLNFRNPAVLMQVLEGLLFYVRREADIIRLDAVTYIWAEPGTDCVHLPETHAIVKLLRDVMDVAAPGVALITETNVPHEDNVSYFGNGNDEAQMVYNFALPPLVLHTFYTQDATAISKWAQNLKVDSTTATFFNMLDTHDGVGVMGVKGILSKTEIDFIIDSARDRGAYISYKMTEHKTEEPYEINTTWWSAINRDESDEEIGFQVRRYIASRSIALVLKGVPGVYTHGVVALPNDHERVKKTGVKRDVNRGMIDSDLLAEELKDPESKRFLLSRMGSRINLSRTGNRAFHPQGDQRVLNVSPDIFSVLRISPERNRHVLTMTNVTDRSTAVKIPLAEIGITESRWRDLVSKNEWMAREGVLPIMFAPYDVIWLVPAGEWEKG
jgi:sucrose phosphorylase